MPALGRVTDQDTVYCAKHDCNKCGHCHHSVRGWADPSSGASKVFIDKLPALRVGDVGNHEDQTCCGDNKWTAMKTIASRGVKIQGKEAFCVGDITLHDGKDQGKLQSGSPTVFVKGKS